jgi:hypothetical protein
LQTIANKSQDQEPEELANTQNDSLQTRLQTNAAKSQTNAKKTEQMPKKPRNG